MRLFRVEHPEDAAGPYCGGAVAFEYARWSQQSAEYEAKSAAMGLLSDRRFELQQDTEVDPHPIPAHDGIDFTSGVHRSAFDTLEKLADWFHEPARALLAEAGFVGAVIEVPDEDVQVGERQAAYVHDTRRLVDVFDLRSLPMAN